MSRTSAQGFVDHLNAVLNRTVTESRLTLVAMPWRDDVFELSRHQSGASAALELADGYLFVRQMIQVVQGRCETLSYTYPYPLGHVHVRADLTDSGEGAGPKHIPTGRVPLELVCLHLIEEWGAFPMHDDWRETLDESLAGFYERRTAP